MENDHAHGHSGVFKKQPGTALSYINIRRGDKFKDLLKTGKPN
jgi:hypothetical protein